MKRRTRFLLAVPLVLLGLSWLVAAWLLGTGAGTRFILARAAGVLDGNLQFQAASGNLTDGVVLSGLRFEDDGLRVEAARFELALDYSLMPLRVDIRRVVVPELVVRLPESEAGGDSDLAALMPELVLPIPVNVLDSEWRKIQLLDAAETTLLQLDRVRLSGVIHEGLDALDLAVEGIGYEARVTGAVGFRAPQAHNLVGWVRFDGALLLEDLPPGITWDITLQGDATSTRLSVAGSPPEMRLEGSIAEPLSRPVLDSQFHLGEWVLPAGEPPSWVLGSASGRLQANADGFRLEAGGNVAEEELGEFTFDIDGHGDARRFVVERLAARASYVELGVTGSLDWADTPGLALESTIGRLDPGHWISDWPRAHELTGRLDLAWRGDLVEIPDFSLMATDTAFSARGSAEIDPAGETLSADLDWQGFAWPLGAETPSVTMESGAIEIAGKPSDWRLQGEIALETPDYPGGAFLLSGTGNRESADVLIDRGQALGGSIAGTAAVDWSGGARWNASLAVDEVDLGAILPDYPIRVSGNVDIRQDTATGEVRLRLGNLHGQIEDSPFSVAGGLAILPHGLVFEQLRLQAGESRVALDGDLHSPDGMAFDVDVRRPGWLSRQVGGNVTGTGRYAPARPNPLDSIQLEGSDLAWEDLLIAGLSIRSGTRNGPGRIDLKADATGVDYAGTALEQMYLDVQGVPGRQDMLIALRDGARALRFGLTGDLVDWSDPLGAGWHGEIQRLSLVLDDKEAMRLRHPAGLSVSARELDLQNACLDNSEGGAVCLALRKDPATGIALTGNLEDLPLDIGKLFFDLDLEFSQALAGDFSWRMAPGGKPSGHAAVEISAGQFGDVEDDDQLVSTGRGYLGFDMRDGNLRSGRAELPLPGIGGIDIDFELTDLALDGTGRIDGSAQVDFTDLAFLENVTSGLDNVRGTLRSSVRITGVTADPRFDGEMSVTGAQFDLPYLGMQVRDINLKGHVDHQDRAVLDGGLSMGAGAGQLEIQADFRELLNPRVDLRLSGEALRVAGLPDLEVDVDTALELGWQGRAWEIDGFVEVPHARVEPITSLSTRVAESEDLHLVAGKMPPAPAKADAGELALIGHLALRLGDDVRLRADIADLAFGGGLDLEWQNTLVPVANGAIEVDGLVTAWGPQLHLVNSRVRFPGVLVNQPVLDIRAERDVFGNTIVRSAGVRVGGNWRRPDIEAYTIPLTTHDRAWTVLITGSDVNLGQGVGALDVGTYIAPRIFLSYGVSLFDTDNVVGIRYDLKKGWGIKATSSQRESGMDISYTIEH